ncbi:MAG: hypothetical protein WBD47_19725 [Phormidesmis sp.]
MVQQLFSMLVSSRLKSLGRSRAASLLRASLPVIAMTTLLPVSAEAASFSSGAPATVLLFRGAGGLLGPLDIRSSSQSGIDALASRIDSEFSDSMLTVRTFDSYEGDIFSLSEVGSSQGTAFAKQIADSSAGETGALGLVGYSGGGLSAIRTAKNLSPNPVDLLV